MGIDWMNRDELAQAIPPAYTHYIGNRLMAYLQNNNLLKERTP
jgi:DNA (cytosine-5)-methyltransferase 1